MQIELLHVPYDSGFRDRRLGAGPEAIERAGLTERLERGGHRVRRDTVELPDGAWIAELGAAFELAAGVATRVRAAREAGAFPIVLSGNCGVALGVCAGLGPAVRVAWADAHGDFNTPETTVGGFLDGMGLATLTGRCWTQLVRRIPGFTPVPDDRVWLLGARDLDPLEDEALRRSRIHRVPAADIGREAAESIARRAGATHPLYLHLDLDVLDPSVGRANPYAAPGGATLEGLAAFVAAIREHASLAAVTLSAYDPSSDPGGRVSGAALRLAEAAVGGRA